MRRVQKRSRVIAKPKEQVLTKEQQLQQLLTQLKACKAKIKELTKAKVAVQKRLSEAKERLKVGKSLVKNAVVFHKKAVIAFQVSRQKSAKASWKAINEAREAVRSSPMMEKIYFYAGKCDESEEWPCSPHVPHVNRELAFPSHVVNKEIAFSHVQGDWSKSSLVVEAEAAIRETERLAGVVNGAQNAINEAKDKCQEVQDECDEIESELDALDEDLKEANDEL
jgi:chaperonin cofactor prefoldin